jgi:hypothetical protein
LPARVEGFRWVFTVLCRPSDRSVAGSSPLPQRKNHCQDDKGGDNSEYQAEGIVARPVVEAFLAATAVIPFGLPPAMPGTVVSPTARTGPCRWVAAMGTTRDHCEPLLARLREGVGQDE